MVNRRYTLSKEERLSWKRYIDLLFAKGQSFVAFPLRVVYLAVEEETLAPVSILVVAFLYLDKEIHPFADMEKAMTKALNVLRDKA